MEYYSAIPAVPSNRLGLNMSVVDFEDQVNCSLLLFCCLFFFLLKEEKTNSLKGVWQLVLL